MDEDFAHLADQHTLGDQPIPAIVLELAGAREPRLAWRNDLGGLTFDLGDRYVKWNPRRSGIDLERERVRLEWISPLHPAPTVIAAGADDQAQWLVTAALPGEPAVGATWRRRRHQAIAAIAAGLRAIHDLPVASVPASFTADSWVGLSPPALGPRPEIEQPVLVHGDACAPNTLISPDGIWAGHVDLGDLAVGDRWADLAIASLSLDWNFGEGHQHELFDAYGIEPDQRRAEYYRSLWRLAS